MANWTWRTGGVVGFFGDLLLLASTGGGASLGMGGSSSLLCHCRQSNAGCTDAAQGWLQPFQLTCSMSCLDSRASRSPSWCLGQMQWVGSNLGMHHWPGAMHHSPKLLSWAVAAFLNRALGRKQGKVVWSYKCTL